MGQETSNVDFDDLLNAIDRGDGYYIICSNGHGSLPPLRVCPECGDSNLRKENLPNGGTIITYTEIRVPAPEFMGETPIVAIADFEGVRLTGRLIGDLNTAEVGLPVTLGVTTSPAGERHLAFKP